MPISHKKAFGIYHWDTFDNATLFMAERDTMEDAEKYVEEHYEGRIRSNGADRVDIVDRKGNIVRQYSVG